MLAKDFKVLRINKVNEALLLLEERGVAYKILAGGTDLIPRIRDKYLKPEMLFDISNIKELKEIILENDYLKIGAGVTHAEIIDNALIQANFPILIEACKTIGSLQIRNKGTIAGNIVNSSPAGDTLPILFALGALVKTQSVTGERTIPIAEFIIGPGKITLGNNELVTEINIPLSSKIIEGIYKKLGIRNALTIATVSGAVLIDTFSNVILALGAVGPVPSCIKLKREYLKSNIHTREDLKKIIISKINPISDIRATLEYRREMAVNLLYEGLIELELLSYS